MTDILGIGHLPQHKDYTINAKYSPENDVGGYPVDSLGYLLPKSETWWPRCIERATPTRSPASMCRVPAAGRTEHLENSGRRFGLPCRCEVCPYCQLPRTT